MSVAAQSGVGGAAARAATSSATETCASACRSEPSALPPARSSKQSTFAIAAAPATRSADARNALVLHKGVHRASKARPSN